MEEHVLLLTCHYLDWQGWFLLRRCSKAMGDWMDQWVRIYRPLTCMQRFFYFRPRLYTHWKRMHMRYCDPTTSFQRAVNFLGDTVTHGLKCNERYISIPSFVNPLSTSYCIDTLEWTCNCPIQKGSWCKHLIAIQLLELHNSPILCDRFHRQRAQWESECLKAFRRWINGEVPMRNPHPEKQVLLRRLGDSDAEMNSQFPLIPTTVIYSFI